MATDDTYVYVASSWRNKAQPVVCSMLARWGIEHYDFRNPPGGTGFSWREVKPGYDGSRVGVEGIREKGSDWESVDEYLRMLSHERALEGFDADMGALDRATHVLAILPCGKSAHLELGYAVGAGKHTAVLLEDPVEPELMYRMVDHLFRYAHELQQWLSPVQIEKSDG